VRVELMLPLSQAFVSNLETSEPQYSESLTGFYAKPRPPGACPRSWSGKTNAGHVTVAFMSQSSSIKRWLFLNNLHTGRAQVTVMFVALSLACPAQPTRSPCALPTRRKRGARLRPLRLRPVMLVALSLACPVQPTRSPCASSTRRKKGARVEAEGRERERARAINKKGQSASGDRPRSRKSHPTLGS
jgi:hypothetical protein